MLVYLQMLDTAEEKHKFEQIYEIYKKPMMKIALRILRNQLDAEDAVHTSFIKIAKNLHKVGSVEDPKTKGFVLIITEHEAINLYHKNKAHSVVELKEWDDGPTVVYDGNIFLTDCILKLPSKYRNMIILKYYHGYSTKEVAEILGISDTNASKIDQRAKKKLEELYNK